MSTCILCTKKYFKLKVNSTNPEQLIFFLFHHVVAWPRVKENIIQVTSQPMKLQHFKNI
jgi:flagellin-specific chaperone FliS